MTPSTNFDWVTARSVCSPAKLFQKLTLEVEQDVKTRQASLPAGCGYGFDFNSNGGSIGVGINGNRLCRMVTFELTEWGIVVRHDQTLLFEAKLTLNDDGECRLKVDGKEYQSWQFRKLALEGFFFDNPWPK